jgi:hypothetical protein
MSSKKRRGEEYNRTRGHLRFRTNERPWPRRPRQWPRGIRPPPALQRAPVAESREAQAVKGKPAAGEGSNRLPPR